MPSHLKDLQFLPSTALNVQDPQSYTNADYTIVFSIFNLMALLSAQSSQTVVRNLKADLAAPNRTFIS